MNMGDPYDVPYVHALSDSYLDLVRALEMVRRIARYGFGPGTTHEEALNTIVAYVEGKLAKVESGR